MSLQRFIITALRPGLVLCGFGLTILAAGAAWAEWPQWRGPDGLGVSTELHVLPETWESGSENIKWRTEIAGRGHSSPIVSNGKVFVTTADETLQSGRLQRVVLVATIASALVFLLLVARGRSTGRRFSWLVLGGSLAFVVIAILMAAMPDTFFPIGKPGRVWRVSGLVLLLGAASALGWFKRDSRMRLTGAIIFAVLGGFLAYFVPHGKLGPAELTQRLILLVPALAGALWLLLSFLRARKHAGLASSRHSSPLAALALILTAAVVFIVPNYLHGLQRVVVCVDLESGEILWQTPVFRAPAEQKWVLGTYATPTPATDGERVYAYFGSGLASLDLEGRVLWLERFQAYQAHTRYGASTSPILTQDAVIVLQEKELFQDAPSSWIAAFDKQSGRRLWEINPDDAQDSYATPMLVDTGDKKQLVTASWEVLAGYDVASGERLWAVDYPLHQVVASMARSDDLLAVTGGVYGDKALMVFEIADKFSGDGLELLWRSNRGVATISSPVFYNDFLFTVTDKGIMTAYEARTGDQVWKQRLEGEHYASLVAGDGKIYATSTDGCTSVVAAGAEFRLIAENQLGETTYATPAVSDGGILIRTAENLIYVENGLDSTQTAAIESP